MIIKIIMKIIIMIIITLQILLLSDNNKKIEIKKYE